MCASAMNGKNNAAKGIVSSGGNVNPVDFENKSLALTVASDLEKTGCFIAQQKHE